MSEAMTQNEVLASLWGWEDDDMGARFRAPLPPTERFPIRRRKVGNIGGVTEVDMPPYLTTWVERGFVVVMVCDATGYRAGYDPASDDESGSVYARGANVPDEWVEPIEAALAEVEAKWPGAVLETQPHRLPDAHAPRKGSVHG